MSNEQMMTKSKREMGGGRNATRVVRRPGHSAPRKGNLSNRPINMILPRTPFLDTLTDANGGEARPRCARRKVKTALSDEND